MPERHTLTNAQEANIHVDTFFPPADRIVAIGDVHGDVDALRGCLEVVQMRLCVKYLCRCSRFVKYFNPRPFVRPKACTLYTLFCYTTTLTHCPICCSEMEQVV